AASVRVRAGAHPLLPSGRQRREEIPGSARVVEQLPRLVGLHPGLEAAQVIGILPDLRDRDLVRAERALDLDAVDGLRSGPPLGRAEHDHRPTRTPGGAAAGALLNLADSVVAGIQRRRQRGMDAGWIVPGDDERLVAMAAQQRGDLLVRS